MRLETLGSLSMLLAALVALEQQGNNASALGLLLTYALQVGGVMGCIRLAWLQLLAEVDSLQKQQPQQPA